MNGLLNARRLLLTLAVVFVVLCAPAVGIFVLNAALDSPSEIEFAAGILQGYVTVVAITAGGAFAIYRFRVFRTLEPHITVSQEVSDRLIGNRHVHVFVTATLYNNSRVEVRIREADFTL